MKIIITKNYDEMSKVAYKVMEEVIKNKPDAVIGLATGTTPLGLYKNMIEGARKGLSYKRVRTVNLDEYRGLDINSDQSYVYFMRKNLFEGLDIDLNNTHIENGKAEDPDRECERYTRLLEELPRDLQLLGIGSNGHIGFCEPNTPFGSTTHVVDLSESTIKDNSRLFSDINAVPRQAFTQGIKNIMNAKKILMICSGENKADAVYKMIYGEVTEQCPASVLQLHPDCTVVVDEGAGKLINKT